MSFSEVGYRVKKNILSHMEKIGFFVVPSPSSPCFDSMPENILPRLHKIDYAEYCREADRIMLGRLDVFSLNDVDLGVVPNWNRNVKTGHIVPLLFGKMIDYRDQNIVGDIKYIWGQNRHLHLVTIAQAYYLSKNQSYLDFINKQLSSWFDQCPYMLGPNWTSSLELSIRLINWCFVWHLIGGTASPMFEGEDGRRLRNRWLTVIYQHVHFIRGHFSRYSSANNHLIGELAGVYVATTCWPCWEEFKGWQQSSFDELVRESLVQNGRDGVNLEQSIFYQHFVLDFMLISGLIGKYSNFSFPASYWNRIEKMLEYLSSVMDVAGNMPMIGDSDDGLVIKLSCEKEFCIYKSLLSTGAIIFSRGEFKKKSRYLDHKTKWLLGDTASSEYDKLSLDGIQLPVSRSFPEGGYYILGADFEAEREVKMIVDAGALGYLSIAAHGHADALSFTLSIAGVEMLIDPGTYVYQSDKEWRNYFRGTSAHNTVRIDGADQSLIGGNFMWLTAAESKCELWAFDENQDHFVGVQNGYMRLDDPVLHRRDIKFYKKSQNRILVTDSIVCSEEHIVEQCWNFSESCEVSLQDRTIVVESKKFIARLEVDSKDSEILIFKGNQQPRCGWVSRKFNIKSPVSAVVITNKIYGTSAITTEISFDFV